MIVPGSRRLGPLPCTALGSVSQPVIDAAPCAVAVAPRGYRHDGGFVPRAIGATWLHPATADRALAVASKLARATAGSVEQVPTVDAGDELRDRLGGLDLIVLRVSPAPVKPPRTWLSLRCNSSASVVFPALNAPFSQMIMGRSVQDGVALSAPCMHFRHCWGHEAKCLGRS